MNRWYNKKLSTIKDNKPQDFWNKKLAAVTEKRNRQMKDGINKVAKIVINHCLENNIATIIFRWNKGNKNQIELGKKIIQNLFQFLQLDSKIEYLNCVAGELDL